MSTPSLHDGHRQRLIAKFVNHGADSLEDHELLEMLLFYAVPRHNTNGTAHLLINECGQLKSVFSADPIVLQSVEGVGEKVSIYLNLIGEIYRRFERPHNIADSAPAVFNTLSKTVEFLHAYYFSLEHEVLCAIFLGPGRHAIKFLSLMGAGNTVTADPCYIANLASRYNANSVILSHNHPNGSTKATQEDKIFTRILEEKLNAIGIFLLDHIIITDDGHNAMLSRRPVIGKQDITDGFYDQK